MPLGSPIGSDRHRMIVEAGLALSYLLRLKNARFCAQSIVRWCNNICEKLPALAGEVA